MHKIGTLWRPQQRTLCKTTALSLYGN